MKKVITILAILVVLTSAVFAASETHTLRLSATVDTVLPQFQLVYGDYRTNNGQTINAFADEADYDLTENAINVSDVLVLDKEVLQTIPFSVVIANAAKAGTHGGDSRAYRLTFSGGDFSVTKAGKRGTISATIETALGDEAGSLVSGVGEDKAVVTLSSTPTTAGGEVVKVNYKYTGDKTVDPYTYTTDIILSIEQI